MEIGAAVPHRQRGRDNAQDDRSGGRGGDYLDERHRGIMLTHAAFARASTMNSGMLADESQSFRMVAKAPLTFDW